MSYLGRNNDYRCGVFDVFSRHRCKGICRMDRIIAEPMSLIRISFDNRVLWLFS